MSRPARAAFPPPPSSSATSPLASDFGCERSLLAGCRLARGGAGDARRGGDPRAVTPTSAPRRGEPRTSGKCFSFLSQKVSDFWVTSYGRLGEFGVDFMALR